MAGLTIYLTARDALQSAGIFQPDYEISAEATYHFLDSDGSVFTVKPDGWFSSAKREFVAGPRKGETETISSARATQYRKQAEAEWGRCERGNLISEPRFIPGTKRKTLPLYSEEFGDRREIGFIDEKGVHYHAVPLPAVA